MGSDSWVLVASAFALLAIWETFAPWRELRSATARRWTTNLALWLAGAISWRWIAATGVIGAAVLARHGSPSEWWRVAITIPLLDFARYGFHRACHGIPWLWRIHSVHHSDTELDCTTGLRFHPLEAVAEQAWAIAWVYALALPPLAVAADVLLAALFSLAEHANISLPRPVEWALRPIFVTPETHRIHHSTDPRDHNGNFGNIFAVWDRLFRTHRPSPAGLLNFGVPASIPAAERSRPVLRLGNHARDTLQLDPGFTAPASASRSVTNRARADHATVTAGFPQDRFRS